MLKKNRKFVKNSGLFLNMAKWCFGGLFFEVHVILVSFWCVWPSSKSVKMLVFPSLWGFFVGWLLLVYLGLGGLGVLCFFSYFFLFVLLLFLFCLLCFCFVVGLCWVLVLVLFFVVSCLFCFVFFVFCCCCCCFLFLFLFCFRFFCFFLRV